MAKLPDLLRKELIGLAVKVVGATNASLVGVAGTIVDETKHTLTIESDGKTRMILKEQVQLALTINGTPVTIDGLLLVARPEDRIKKKHALTYGKTKNYRH